MVNFSGEILFSGYGYFVGKTVLSSPFLTIKWPHGRKKTASDYFNMLSIKLNIKTKGRRDYR